MAEGHHDLKVLETKVVVLGHTGVGKTSIVNSYVRGSFTGNTTATIGAAFMKKDIVVNGWNIVLQIWDTAGQERFRSMAPMYYRGAHAAILCYDVTAPQSLEKVEGWVEELQQHANEDIVIVVAGNKCDLRKPGDDSVPLARGQGYAKSIGAQLFETSAKSKQGIEELFNYVAKNLLKLEKERQKYRNKPPVDPVLDMGGSGGKQKSGGCCSS